MIDILIHTYTYIHIYIILHTHWRKMPAPRILRLTSILIRLTIKVRHGTYIEVPYVVIMSLSERIDIDTNSTNEQARTPRFRMVIMSLLNRVIGGVVPLRLYTGTANRIIAFPIGSFRRNSVIAKRKAKELKSNIQLIINPTIIANVIEKMENNCVIMIIIIIIIVLFPTL